jgi:hypothetical protein
MCGLELGLAGGPQKTQCSFFQAFSQGPERSVDEVQELRYRELRGAEVPLEGGRLCFY